MTSYTKLLAVLATTALLASPAFAAPGGNGGGNGNGGSQGNGGNSGGAGSQGHGAATSEAARDKSTTGVAKALSVVGTTPASPQATLSLQAVLDKLLAREDDDTGEDPEEVVEPVE